MDKGNLAELIIAAELTKQGYRVALPYGNAWRADLIVEKDGKFLRVQCKYIESDGKIIRVPCRSACSWKVTSYTPKEIDWIIVYDRTTERIFYIPSSLLGRNGRRQINLRIAPPGNHQKLLIRPASDFEHW